MSLDFLLNPNIEPSLIIKFLVILGLIFYQILTVVVVRAVDLMNHVLGTNISQAIRVLALLQAIGVFFFLILAVIFL